MTVDTLLNILIVLPQFPLMAFFIGRFIRAEKLWVYILVITVPLSAAYVLLSQWTAVQWAVTMAFFLAFVLTAAGIPRGYAVLYLFIGTFLMFAGDMILVILIRLLFPEYADFSAIPAHTVMLMRLFSLPFLALVWTLSNMLCRRLFHLDTDHEMKRYTPFLILECLILLVVHLVTLSIASDIGTLPLIFNLSAIIGFVVLDLLLAGTVRKLDRVHEAELKQQQTLELLRSQAHLYETVRENSNAVRRLRHDMMNQLQGISYLLKNGDTALASAQLHAYMDALSGTDVRTYTGDPVADAVIGTRMSAMDEAGIRFSCTGSLPKDTAVDSAVLCSLLSNLLDNAVRGCMKTDDADKRSISLHTGILNDRLVLRCDNTCPAGDEADTGDTSAWNREFLCRTAEENGGDAVFDRKDGIYTAVIQLRPAGNEYYNDRS